MRGSTTTSRASKERCTRRAARSIPVRPALATIAVPMRTESQEEPLRPRKAGLLQVAKTMFFGLLMIGKKETWEKGGDGARMTSAQVVGGAVIASIVVIAVLLSIVRVAIGMAGG